MATAGSLDGKNMGRGADLGMGVCREYRDARKIPLNVEHRMMLGMAPDYDHLMVIQKVEVFEHALDSTSGAAPLPPLPYPPLLLFHFDLVPLSPPLLPFFLVLYLLVFFFFFFPSVLLFFTISSSAFCAASLASVSLFFIVFLLLLFLLCCLSSVRASGLFYLSFL